MNKFRYHFLFVLGLVLLASALLTRPDTDKLVPLYLHALKPSEHQTMEKAFQKAGFEFQVPTNSFEFRVPSNELLEIRRFSVVHGLTSGPSRLKDDLKSGQELEDYGQKVEGELEELIRSLLGVDNAMVKLAIPDPTFFCDPKDRKCKVRIFVMMKPTQSLNEEVWNNLRHTIALLCPTPELGSMIVINLQGQTVYQWSNETDVVDVLKLP